MRSAIAIIMALLGVILVLSGAAALWAAALARSESDEGNPPVDRRISAMSRLPGPHQLIIWGVVMLALAAVASGAITFSVAASAG